MRMSVGGTGAAAARAYRPTEASGVGRTLGPADGLRMTPLALKGSPPE